MPTVNETLLRDLRALGVKSGGRLLVHASYKSLGEVAGGPETIIDTLLAAVGEAGTLLFPTLSYETVNAEHPYFDVRSTPSCVGLLPECFRKRPSARRSVHPTHSVAAIGRDAVAMTSEHFLDETPVGARSPFRKLRDMGGQILFLGCGLTPNTSMHGVEELACPPYLFLPEPIEYTCVDEMGVARTMRVARHNFEDDGRELIQRYDRAADILSGNALLYGRVLAAECFLLDAKRLWDTAEAVMRQKPLYFVD